MDNPDFERFLNSPELEKKWTQLINRELTLTKMSRSIEFSNITLAITENARLKHIPKVGEGVNGYNVTNVEYDIMSGIRWVELTLETEIKIHQNLSFDEAQVYRHINTHCMVGRSKKSDEEKFKTIFYEGFNPTEISEEQFDEWFPIIQQK